MPPCRTSVVRLLAYRREEFLDRHQPHAPVADPRPFLVLLSPDTLQLVTASDAADSQPAVASLLQQVSARPDRTPRRTGVRPLALLHKLSHAGQGGAGGSSVPGSADGSPTDGAGLEGGSAGGAEELGAELAEGQILTFSIALSQVADLERDERRIKAGSRAAGRGPRLSMPLQPASPAVDPCYCRAVLYLPAPQAELP